VPLEPVALTVVDTEIPVPTADVVVVPSSLVLIVIPPPLTVSVFDSVPENV
jgi:hypothetical protein